jgi:hypothetical protein
VGDQASRGRHAPKLATSFIAAQDRVKVGKQTLRLIAVLNHLSELSCNTVLEDHLDYDVVRCAPSLGRPVTIVSVLVDLMRIIMKDISAEVKYWIATASIDENYGSRPDARLVPST